MTAAVSIAVFEFALFEAKKIFFLRSQEPAVIRLSNYELTYYRAPEHTWPPVNWLDPYDTFQKDAEGNLLISATGSNLYLSVAQATYIGYELQTKGGRPVMVFQSSPARRWRYKTNCHGFVFLGSDYWLQCDQIDRVLEDNHWSIVFEKEAQPGDVAIYRDLRQRILHSARVVGRNPKGEVLVDSKDGYDNVIRNVCAELIVP